MKVNTALNPGKLVRAMTCTVRHLPDDERVKCDIGNKRAHAFWAHDTMNEHGATFVVLLLE